jgi:adenosylhomocysteine nucleosidase
MGAEIAANYNLSSGKLVSSPRAVSSLQEKAALFRATGAVAVDMESWAIAQIAVEHSLPFIAVRVIVDGAQDALPMAVTAAADAQGQLHPWRLVRALARTPADLGALVRLARRYRVANRSLAMMGRAGSLARSAATFPLTDSSSRP